MRKTLCVSALQADAIDNLSDFLVFRISIGNAVNPTILGNTVADRAVWIERRVRTLKDDLHASEHANHRTRCLLPFLTERFFVKVPQEGAVVNKPNNVPSQGSLD